MWDESSHQLLGFDQEARDDTAHRGMMEIEADTAKELPCSKREREKRGRRGWMAGQRRCEGSEGAGGMEATSEGK